MHGLMDLAMRRRITLEHLPGNQGPMYNSDGIDHINNLPTELICRILSFLPTKDAVRTSILSTKWKNLLPLIPNLKILLEDPSFVNQYSHSDTSIINFKNFVGRLLNVTLCSLPNVPPSVVRFSLCCGRSSDGREVAKWIDTALNLNIKCLELGIWGSENPEFLLGSLFGSNIITLNLSLNFYPELMEFKFSLPNLKTLRVQSMKSNVVNVLLESCPVLQTLELCFCIYRNGEAFQVCKPSLRVLEFVTNRNVRVGEFVLSVPNLEHIRYEGFLPRRLSTKRFEFLQSACFYLDESCTAHPDEPNEQTDVLVKVCANVEKLCLSGKIIRMLHDYPHALPRFQRLFRLLIPKMDSYGWELLPRLLDSAPNFTNLVLESGFNNKSYKHFKASLDKSFSICLTRYGQNCYNLVFGRKAEPAVKTCDI